MTDDPRVTPEMHKAGLAEAYRFPGGSVDVDAIYLAMDAARPAVTRNRVEAAITAYHGGDEWLTNWSDPSIKSEREYMSRALAAADRATGGASAETPHAWARAEVMAAAHALAHGRGLGTLSSNVDRLRRAVSDLEKLERTTDEISPPPWATIATPATDGVCSNHPDTTHETPGAAGVAGGAPQTPGPVWTKQDRDLLEALGAVVAGMAMEGPGIIRLRWPRGRRTAKTSGTAATMLDDLINDAFPPAAQRAENGDG